MVQSIEAAKDTISRRLRTQTPKWIEGKLPSESELASFKSGLNIQSILSSSSDSNHTGEGSRIAITASERNDPGGLPVGAWVGIGFAVVFFLTLCVVLFFGHRKVTDYLVAIVTRKSRNSGQGVQGVRNSTPLHTLPPRSSSIHMSKISHTGSASTPRTMIPDIPFASIEIESDGRLSPRLPIPSKRGSSLPGTPNNLQHRR
jgi:hypothetical protein